MRLSLIAVPLLIICGCTRGEPPLRADGDYSSPHPSAAQMRHALLQHCGVKQIAYDPRSGVLTVWDPFHNKVSSCMADYAQKHGVIPLPGMEIP